jgi:hypothetical protein
MTPTKSKALSCLRLAATDLEAAIRRLQILSREPNLDPQVSNDIRMKVNLHIQNLQEVLDDVENQFRALARKTPAIVVPPPKRNVSTPR